MWQINLCDKITFSLNFFFSLFPLHFPIFLSLISFLFLLFFSFLFLFPSNWIFLSLFGSLSLYFTHSHFLSLPVVSSSHPLPFLFFSTKSNTHTHVLAGNPRNTTGWSLSSHSSFNSLWISLSNSLFVVVFGQGFSLAGRGVLGDDPSSVWMLSKG